MRNIPEGQLLFKLGEVAERLGLEIHVLRYWEKEFASFIKPLKISQRKRLYGKEDLETFSSIKRLLYEERFTVEGAKKQLSGGSVPRANKLFDYVNEPAAGAGPKASGGRAGAKEKGRKDSALGAAGGGDFPAVAPESGGASREMINEIRRGLLSLKSLILNGSGETEAEVEKNPEDGGLT
ncbi:MAG: MerR family transcriptional regulator [Deltaproteobacteria bacterium]|nr:MerR family transcriptional regulator [Deltaproteobacteria bacterium]